MIPFNCAQTGAKMVYQQVIGVFFLFFSRFLLLLFSYSLVNSSIELVQHSYV